MLRLSSALATLSLAAVSLAAVLTACSGEAAAPTAPPAPPAAAPPVAPPAPMDPVAEAAGVFKNRCALCHGETGMGDTVTGKALVPPPRNYTDAAWQASVTDEYLAKVIVEGGAAVGKSPLMAANIDLKDKPEVVKALVAKVRSFGAAGGAAAPAPGGAAPGGAAPAPAPAPTK